MSLQQNIDLDKKYNELQQQVNGIQNNTTDTSSKSSIFNTLLKPPYLYFIIIFVSVFGALLYFKPSFIMNVDREEVTDVQTQQKLPKKLSLNIGKLFLFSFIISAVLIGSYYLYRYFSKKK